MLSLGSSKSDLYRYFCSAHMVAEDIGFPYDLKQSV